MKIGIDIDDCIAQSVEFYCAAANRLFGKTINVRSLIHPSGKLEEAGLITKSEFQKLHSELIEHRFLRELKPFPNTAEVINRLSIENDLIFITSRDNYEEEKVRKDTEYWFKHIGVEELPRIIYSKKKGLVAKKERIDFFIEDRLDYASQLQSKDIEVILFDRPWNSESTIPRFSDWQNILDFINKKNE